VNETIFWQGVNYRDGVHDKLIPLRFAQPRELSSCYFIDLFKEPLYPVEYMLPRFQELIQAVSLLFIAHLNSPVSLYFLVKNQSLLKELLLSVYQAIASTPIHEGVLRQMAAEPPNYNQYDSQHLSWDEIKEQSHKTHKDITRSPNLTIKAGRELWEIQEDKNGADKEKLFQEAMNSLQRMNTLPRVVLDALQLGAHQSGFLNEAVIAVGVYVNEMTNYQITLPQSGIRRWLNFTVINNYVEVTDRCEWHEITAPLRSPGGSELDVTRVSLRKPLTLIYRYELSENNQHRLSHQIKELSLRHESKIKKLAGLK
jgi:hypothetical protein